MTQDARTSTFLDQQYEAAGILNIAAAANRTQALGPGLRAVVWVQGCAFHCPGCIAPDWIALQPAHLVTVEEVADYLLADPLVTGLTFSGGEPMLQAAALARLAHLVRMKRDVDIICFSGFQRAQLEKDPPVPGVADLLGQIDVLIDGPYIAALNDNLGLRGSSNQRIHHLTSRLAEAGLESWARRSEIRLMDGQAVMIGVPPKRMGEAFHQALNQAQMLNRGLLQPGLKQPEVAAP